MKYLVYYEMISHGATEVEANNESEAVEKIHELYDNGNISYDDDFFEVYETVKI